MIFGKAKILRSHGWQYIPDLYSVTLTEEFRGFPELSDTQDKSDVERAAKICPTKAITTEPLTLDMGRCLFCGECASAHLAISASRTSIASQQHAERTLW